MPDTLDPAQLATTSTTNGDHDDMKIDPARAAVLQQNLASVLVRIESAAGGRPVGGFVSFLSCQSNTFHAT
jgi:hypothetical protein